MSFCKICDCGQIVTAEKKSAFPPDCPSCGRMLWMYPVYRDDDPIVLQKKSEQPAAPDLELSGNSLDSLFSGGWEETQDYAEKDYCLILGDGSVLRIPPEGGIIGRMGIGAEILENYPSVSREHLQVTPVSGRGLLVEDLSTYGTLVNGTVLEKTESVWVSPGATITLCNVETVVQEKDAVNWDE